jgi:carbamoyltransferase
MTLILGLNAWHPDSGACLLADGKLVAAITEERLGKRIKHFSGFPEKAISRVLQMASASISDVEYVAFGHNHNANLTAKIRHIAANPIKSIGSVANHISRRGKAGSIKTTIANACGVRDEACRFNIIEVEHHLAHLASSFYLSPFDEAAGFTYDGSGDFVSAMYARCQDCKIEILDRVFVPHSLGFFYTALCQFIGFDQFGEEYKVMGLSAYGEPRFMELMDKIIHHSEKGQFHLDSRYVKTLGGNVFERESENDELVLPRMFTDSLVAELGPARVRGSEITQRDKDVAASCQKHFENIVIKCAHWLHSAVPSSNLITAGGCALNGVCNARLLRDTPFRNSYIHGAASDDGTAVGAALYTWHEILQKPRGVPLEHSYFGPEYTAAELEAALHKHELKFTRPGRDQLLSTISSELNAGKIIGWYQGRSEWGPRALGNRSILAHPGWPGMKDLINKRIKRRESFRPFAPTILAEEVPNYFEQNVASPFMMHVVRIRPEKRSELAAVTHEDFTGRLHSVIREQNPLYYDLIKKFQGLSGTPVLLNTSFNENEPIVDTPEQAIACFCRNDLDTLCLGEFVVKKS